MIPDRQEEEEHGIDWGQWLNVHSYRLPNRKEWIHFFSMRIRSYREQQPKWPYQEQNRRSVRYLVHSMK